MNMIHLERGSKGAGKEGQNAFCTSPQGDNERENVRCGSGFRITLKLPTREISCSEDQVVTK